MTLPYAVYLFDIDGTLVSAGGAGRRAFERAVADHHGPIDGVLRELRLAGLTDRLIVRKALALLGRPFDDAHCDALLDRYVEHLRTEIQGPGYAVLPGAVRHLARRLDGASLRRGLPGGGVMGGFQPFYHR